MWRIRFAYWRGADPARARRALSERDVLRPPSTLQVFAKNPVPGQVKTRLAAAIGDDEAAAIYARFVERTLDTAVAARAAGVVDRIELWGAPDTDAPAFAEWRDRYRRRAATRSPGSTSARECATRSHSALASGSRADPRSAPIVRCSTCAISRAPSRPSTIIDAVFGPAEDGGYVLVGLARAIDAFSGIPWSSADTMAATRAKLAAQRRALAGAADALGCRFAGRSRALAGTLGELAIAAFADAEVG